MAKAGDEMVVDEAYGLYERSVMQMKSSFFQRCLLCQVRAILAESGTAYSEAGYHMKGVRREALDNGRKATQWCFDGGASKNVTSKPDR